MIDHSSDRLLDAVVPPTHKVIVRERLMLIYERGAVNYQVN
jgi:hypothetical protein